MNILLLGSGGRECTLAWKMAQSKHLNNLYIAPGNAGTSEYGININVNPENFDSVKEAIDEYSIDCIVIGPEAPLVKGLHDDIKSDPKYNNVLIIGPKKEGAQLEGSKDFSKQFMKRHNIPTAKYQSFTLDTIENAYVFLEELKPPYVLKADGLAAGKGVLIINDLSEAKASLREMLEGKFGTASKKVVIEEFLSGIELSVFVYTDGKDYCLLPEAKDYKRIGEGDTGLNTGGMGAVTPVPFADTEFMNKISTQIIEPTIEGLKKDKIDYTGFIFFGLINVKNEPFVIEYNARLGDPETEVILPRLKTDLLEIFIASKNNTLSEIDIEFVDKYACTVMLVSDGYPGSYKKGHEIYIPKTDDSLMLHAGTKLSDDKVLTNGGRILAVTSFGESMQDALNTSYFNAEKIKFEGKYYRKDIGFDL